MGVGWIKRYCFTCRERTPFEYLGTQIINNGKRKYSLYNCKICHTTRAFDLKDITTKLEGKNGN
jgi:hypothetical protein